MLSARQERPNRGARRDGRKSDDELEGGPATLSGLARFWRLWLVLGIAWALISLVILQFDDASITTVGILIGLMFFFSGIQNFAIASMVDRGGWLYGVFGVLFVIAGVISFI